MSTILTELSVELLSLFRPMFEAYLKSGHYLVGFFINSLFLQFVAI
jgi:hypothetical protein